MRCRALACRLAGRFSLDNWRSLARLRGSLGASDLQVNRARGLQPLGAALARPTVDGLLHRIGQGRPRADFAARPAAADADVVGVQRACFLARALDHQAFARFNGVRLRSLPFPRPKAPPRQPLSCDEDRSASLRRRARTHRIAAAARALLRRAGRLERRAQMRRRTVRAGRHVGSRLSASQGRRCAQRRLLVGRAGRTPPCTGPLAEEWLAILAALCARDVT